MFFFLFNWPGLKYIYHMWGQVPSKDKIVMHAQLWLKYTSAVKKCLSVKNFDPIGGSKDC